MLSHAPQTASSYLSANTVTVYAKRHTKCAPDVLTPKMLLPKWQHAEN